MESLYQLLSFNLHFSNYFLWQKVIYLILSNFLKISFVVFVWKSHKKQKKNSHAY